MSIADKMAQVLESFIDETVDYMTINNLGDAEKKHNVRWARKVLAEYRAKPDA